MLALGGEKVFVSPIRLPSEISTDDNPQLQQTLTTLRESQMDKFILHSMDKSVVTHVLKAVGKLYLQSNQILTILSKDNDKLVLTTLNSRA